MDKLSDPETQDEAARYLRAIDDMLSLLQEQKLSGEQDGYVDTIKTSVAALKTLMKSVEQKSSPGKSASSPRVLVVDDDAVQRMWASRTLEQAGFTVVCADSGPEALASVAKNRWDIILMDCEIPELDGFEVTKRIRESEKATGSYTPIVAYSAYKIPGYRERCIKIGMDRFLSKPATPAEMVVCLKSTLTNI
jgi:CheY-like chemotaxis protein